MSTPTATMTGTSLLVSGDPQAGDTTLCYTCHGIGQLGSNVDVQTPFQGSSVHTLAPAGTTYGPSPLYCSSCHDPHGSKRTAAGAPYPSLLRSYEGTHTIYSGEAYCATCHTDATVGAQKEHWSGLDVYMTTAHYSAIATPTSGTEIRCSRCHAAHGSNVAPLLVPSIVPTSVATTFTVTADDRTFCEACHPTSAATWPAAANYAASSHARSSITTTISARWVPAGKRKVGECQVCHAPMGRDDGTGTAIPKLLDAAGRKLCDACHSAGGVASTDTSSQARPMPGNLTLAAVFAPDNNSAYAGRVSLYGRVASGAGALQGPKQYSTDDGTGPSVVGNIDADADDELIVASTTDAAINVFDKDPLTGLDLSPDRYAIPGGLRATAIAVGDFLGDISDTTPEIAVVTTGGRLNFYHITLGVLELVDGSVDLGAGGPWALASGDIDGTSQPELVATSKAEGTLTIVSRNGLWTPTATTVWAGTAPVAPVVGNVRTNLSGDEIVVCDAAAGATETIRVFDGDGSLVEDHMVSASTGMPTATAFGDLLWANNSDGLDDLAISFADSTSGESSVVVVPSIAGGLDFAADIEVASGGTGSFSGSVLIGDTDGDDRAELVVGNGGRWSRTGSAFAPRVLVFASNATGTGLSTPASYRGGGNELAGRAPYLALADFGKPLPSRHPIDEVAGASHVSTEKAAFDRHVTCADCHNSHEATDVSSAAPAVPGPMLGAWGVGVTYPGKTFSDPARAETGYAVCFKCHSSYNGGTAGGRIDAAADFDPANASVHAVVAPGTSSVPAATFVDAGMTGTSILSCTDCHGDDGRSAGQAAGLHESKSAPLLASPYLGADPADSSTLCYDCHKFGVYGTGIEDGVGKSFFRNTDGDNLHSIHVARAAAPEGHGLSCSACHASHGSTNAHLMRSDIGYTPLGAHSGSCTNDCHNTGTGANGAKDQVW